MRKKTEEEGNQNPGNGDAEDSAQSSSWSVESLSTQTEVQTLLHSKSVDNPDTVGDQQQHELASPLTNAPTPKTWMTLLQCIFGIETIMLLHGIGYQGMLVIVQNFYIDRICRVSDNFTAEVCDTLLKNSTTEKVVELTESDYLVYQTAVEMILPLVFAMFLGPCTDKHGTKPIIILSLFGYFTSSVMYIVFLFCPLLPPYYILFCSVPIAVTGGAAAFVISTFSHVMKTSSPEQRSYKLTVLGIVWDFGGLLGCLAGSEIFKGYGFLPVFLLGCCAYLTAIIITVIFIRERKLPETVIVIDSVGSETDSKGCCCTTICSTTHNQMQDIFSICFKRREGNTRRIMLCLAVCLPLQLLAYNSKTTYQYLYVRTKYGWDEVWYSYYTATSSFIGTIGIGGVIITLLILQWLELKDIYVVIINVISNMSGYITYGFSTLGWHMYLGSAIQMFGSTTPAVLRAMLSKLVPVDEQGKLMTIVTCGELSMPLVASYIYRAIYTKTMSTFPGAIFIAASLIHFTILGIIMYVWILSRRRRAYQPLVAE